MITQEQYKELQERVAQLHRYLDIDAKIMQHEEEQLRTQDPEFWNDRERAEEQMKLVKGLEKWINGYNEVCTLTEEVELSLEFYRNEMVSEEEVDESYAKALNAIEALELKNMLREEEDAMACQRAHKRIVESFPLSRVYQVHIPTYPSGHWLFGFSSKKYHPLKDLDEARWNARGLKCRYYTTTLHRGSFYVPAYVEELLEDVE